jgi:transposase
VLGSRPPARIVIEATTDSEWVARRLEALGHEVTLVLLAAVVRARCVRLGCS